MGYEKRSRKNASDRWLAVGTVYSIDRSFNNKRSLMSSSVHSEILPEERKVVVQQHGKCDAVDPHEWPSGKFLSMCCQSVEGDHKVSSISDQSKSVDQETAQERWQASARRAMLEKFGYVLNRNVERKTPDIIFLPGEIDAIQRLWKEVVDDIADQGFNRHVNEIDIPSCRDIHHQDFVDFIMGHCCNSNGRQLQWSVMSCPRGVQFPLHAHPNLELIYCIRGALFEVRMCGEPITRTFKKSVTGNDSETTDSTSVIGPDLTNTKRSWSFGTLQAGQWLVNEVGSIHKSFTSVRSDGGCDLLVLWGGSHANIQHPPVAPNIQKAIDEVEQKLQTEDSCCVNVNNLVIPETFLPDSER